MPHTQKFRHSLPFPRSRTAGANGVTPLMKSGALFAFGPCVLDTAERALSRDREEVFHGKPHLALVILFTSWPGEVIPSDELIDTGCPEWR